MRYNLMIGRPRLAGLAAIALLVGLGGCGETRQALGLDKDPPDEFQVVSRAPLSMPPDFYLRPPEPGAPRPQEGTPRTQAETVIFGETAARTESAPQAPASGGLQLGGALGGMLGGDPSSSSLSSSEPAAGGGPSAGELALLQEAGATNADSSIRAVIDKETADMVAQDSDFMEGLVFWRESQPFGTVVDPAAEQQRLQENAALGRPVTEGETPTIERKKRALLEGLF